MLDPIVVSKINFITSEEMEDYIELKNIPAAFRNDESKANGYIFRYLEQSEEEKEKLNKLRSDTEKEKSSMESFKSKVREFLEVTYSAAWDNEKRNRHIEELKQCYSGIVPFVR